MFSNLLRTTSSSYFKYLLTLILKIEVIQIPLVPHSTSFRMEGQHLGFQLFWLAMLNCPVYAVMQKCENLPNQKHF